MSQDRKISRSQERKVPLRNDAPNDIYFYRPVSLFSTFVVGLCIFGMEYGFVTNSKANRGLWGVLSLVFLVSQILLHSVDKTTRNQLFQLPATALNATEPLTLLRLYHTSLTIDTITLILLLLVSYFFKFPEPIIASISFVLLTISWYNTNELRIYFIESLEHSPDGINVRHSFDGINACTSLYVVVYFIWLIVFIHFLSDGAHDTSTIILLSFVAILQGIRIWFQTYSLLMKNKYARKRKERLIIIGILLVNNAIISNILLIYGTNNDSNIFTIIDRTQYLFVCYGLNILLVLSINERVQCVLLSAVIILQTISLSPHLLNAPYRFLMLIAALLNLFVLIRMTISVSSLMIHWRSYEQLILHLAFPKLYLISYAIGILVTNTSAIYMIFKVYFSNVNYVWHQTKISLNCSYDECINLILMMATWFPISMCLNNENTRFMKKINAYDGSPPLIPLSFLLLLLSVEIGLIQYDECLSDARLLLSVTVIIIASARTFLLLISI